MKKNRQPSARLGISVSSACHEKAKALAAARNQSLSRLFEDLLKEEKRRGGKPDKPAS